MELEDKELTDYVVGNISLEFAGEPLHYTNVDAHGNPQISGVASVALTWKLRELARQGKIPSQYDAMVHYSYEVINAPVLIPVSQRFPRPDICPICGQPITVADLDENFEVSEEFGPGIVATSSRPRVDTICDGDVVVHSHCAKEYQRLHMIDEITETVGAVFDTYEVDEKYQFQWGKGSNDMWYEFIPNEYCSRECCTHRPWFLFHTPVGSIKIGWRKRVISITFMEDFAAFDMAIFDDENVTKYVDQGRRTIHAWGYEKLYDYLNRVRKVVIPDKKS